MENRLQKLCGKLTRHKYRKCYAYTEDITPPEYYCWCRLCRYNFYTEKRPKKLPGEEQK